MGAGRKLLTPVVVAAALARSRGRGGPAAEPYPDGGPVGGTRALQTTGGRGRHATPSGRSGSSGSSGSSAGGPPGRDADKPTQVPAAGWKEILKRTKQQVALGEVPGTRVAGKNAGG